MALKTNTAFDKPNITITIQNGKENYCKQKRPVKINYGTQYNVKDSLRTDNTMNVAHRSSGWARM